MNKNVIILCLGLSYIGLGVFLYNSRPIPKVKAATEDSKNTLVVATSTEDHDQDGILSSWEILYGFDHTDPSDATLDPDGDLLDNLGEFLYSTDPLNPDTDGGTLEDGKEVIEGKDPLDSTDDLIYNKTVSAGPGEQKHDGADSDGDGLKNDQEKKYFTDPNDSDTDNDGVGDFDEIFKYQTNPLNWDTDGDGLKDGEEIFTYGTDPNLADTDFDGIIDGDEINIYLTNPLLFDTDGGQTPDGDEITNVTDPFDDSDDLDLSMDIFILGVNIDEFQIQQTSNNILNIYSGINVEVIISASDTSKIIEPKLTINNNNYSPNMVDQNNIQFILDIPERSGTYPIKFSFKDSNDKQLIMTKYVNVLKPGVIYGRAEGVFKDLLNYLDIGKHQIIKSGKITLYKYNQDLDIWSVYNSPKLQNENPQKLRDGKYIFVTEPGLYRAKVSKYNTQDKEIFFYNSKYSVLSKNIYIVYNYDNYIWGLLFVVIFNITYAIVKYIKTPKTSIHLPRNI